MTTQSDDDGDFTERLIDLVVKDLAFVCDERLWPSLAQTSVELHFADAEGAYPDLKMTPVQNPEQLDQVLVKDAVEAVEVEHRGLL